MTSPRLSRQIEAWQEDGRYTFTRDDVARALGHWTTSTRDTLRRLQRERRLVRPRSGFYAIVPPEYRRVGTPPPTWFVDALMSYLSQPYYIGLLSAAAMYGATHHQPQELQVITNQPTRLIRLGRARVRFIMNRRAAEVPVRTLNTPTGTVRVSTPAATAFDLVSYLHHAGELGNVITVLETLANEIDPNELAALADDRPIASVRRLGYLLSRAGADRQANALAPRAAASGGRAVTPLHPAAGNISIPDHNGPAYRDIVDARWRILVNSDVRPEDDA